MSERLGPGLYVVATPIGNLGDLSPEDQAQLERSGGFAFHVSGDFTGLELKFWAVRD